MKVAKFSHAASAAPEARSELAGAASGGEAERAGYPGPKRVRQKW